MFVSFKAFCETHGSLLIRQTCYKFKHPIKRITILGRVYCRQYVVLTQNENKQV